MSSKLRRPLKAQPRRGSWVFPYRTGAESAAPISHRESHRRRGDGRLFRLLRSADEREFSARSSQTTLVRLCHRFRHRAPQPVEVHRLSHEARRTPVHRRRLVPCVPVRRHRQLQGGVQGGLEFLVRPARQFPGTVDPQADHVGGLSGGVVKRLGELDAFPPQLPFPGH